MKRTLNIFGTFSLLLVTYNLFSQSHYQRLYKGLGGNESWGYFISEFHQTIDSNFIIAGSMNTSIETAGVFILKIDSLGNVIYGKNIFTGSGLDYIMPTSDGGYLINTTQQKPWINWNHGAMLIKLNSQSDVIWSKAVVKSSINIDNNAYNRAYHSIETLDKHYITVGETSPAYPTANDILIIKSDTSGTTIWSKSVGTSQYEWPSKILSNDNKHFIVGSYFNQPNNSRAILLIRIDDNGTVLWSKTYSLINTFSVTGAVATLGGFYVTGALDSSIYIVKIDTTGNFLWSKSFGSNTLRIISSSVTAQGTGAILTGYTHGNLKGVIISLNEFGDTLFTKSYGDSISHRLYKTISKNNGMFISGTRTESSQSFIQYPFFSKTLATSAPDCMQEISSLINKIDTQTFTVDTIMLTTGAYGQTVSEIMTSVDIAPTDSSICFIVTSNTSLEHDNKVTLFPNPSAREVWIRMETDEISYWELKVYDYQSRIIHSESFKTSSDNRKIDYDFSSGTYIIKLNSAKKSYTGRVVVIK
ncbi:MAG: T9SS type A sorting domain-containing protein [Chitinophagales bacterium]|nr:T9SS type A sorting domain-containing protein [Chitinophagales bacterium]